MVSKAADQGNVDAQTLLGMLYHYGKGGPQNDVQAGKILQKAAEQGDSLSQYYLGELYNYGKGVPQDYKQAAKWYQKAADQGSPLGQTYLGILYVDGAKVYPKLSASFKMVSKSCQPRKCARANQSWNFFL